ncbi:MAG: GGDEF domain-containing protein [Lachnospirales bacterium]
MLKKMFLYKSYYTFFALIFITLIISVHFVEKTEEIKASNGYLNITNYNSDSQYNVVGTWNYANNIVQPHETDKLNQYYNFDIGINFFEEENVSLSLVINNFSDNAFVFKTPTFLNPHSIYVDGTKQAADTTTNYINNKKDNYITIPEHETVNILMQLNRGNMFFTGFSETAVLYLSQTYLTSEANQVGNLITITFIILLISSVLIYIFAKRASKDDHQMRSAIYISVIGANLVVIYITNYFLYNSNFFSFSHVLSIKLLIAMAVNSITILYYLIITFFMDTRPIRIRSFFILLIYIIFMYALITANAAEIAFLFKLRYLMLIFCISACFYELYKNVPKYSSNNLFFVLIIFLLLLVFIVSTFGFNKSMDINIGIVIFFTISISLLIYDYIYFIDKTQTYINIKDDIESEIVKNLKDLIDEHTTLAQDLKEQKDKEVQLVEQTTKDHLTKVYNRYHANKQLPFYEDNFNSLNRPFSVVMLDIDNFKYINDTFGHDVGDITLTILAKTVMDTVRKTDLVVRWGGEEFIVILDNANLNKAVFTAEKIRLAILAAYIPEVEQITVSLGVAEIQKDLTAEDVINKADEFLLKAKKSGKNRVLPKL